MKINHIALYTSNLEEMKNFYEKYFGARSNDMYHNRVTGLKTYFLSFEDGTRLEIMSRDDVKENSDAQFQLGYNHIAFSVGSREEVDSLTNLLANGGFAVLSKPRITGDGYYESCIIDPDGNRIEIVE